MNGRIYDPTLGRFLQADPFVQAPNNSQSFNRYSYVYNNPLSLTDPSGYIGLHLLKKANRAIIKGSIQVFGSNLVKRFGKLAISACGVGAPVCAAYFSYNYTRATGGTTRQALVGAFRSAHKESARFGSLSHSQKTIVDYGFDSLEDWAARDAQKQQETVAKIRGSSSTQYTGGKFTNRNVRGLISRKPALGKQNTYIVTEEISYVTQEKEFIENWQYNVYYSDWLREYPEPPRLGDISKKAESLWRGTILSYYDRWEIKSREFNALTVTYYQINRWYEDEAGQQIEYIGTRYKRKAVFNYTGSLFEVAKTDTVHLFNLPWNARVVHYSCIETNLVGCQQ